MHSHTIVDPKATWKIFLVKCNSFLSVRRDSKMSTSDKTASAATIGAGEVALAEISSLIEEDIFLLLDTRDLMVCARNKRELRTCTGGCPF